MGEVQGTLFPLEFNHSLKLRSTPEGLTADAGAVFLREVGERLGLWKLLEEALGDSRDPELITHPFGELLRTAVLLAAQPTLSRLMTALGEPENRKALAAHRPGTQAALPGSGLPGAPGPALSSVAPTGAGNTNAGQTSLRWGVRGGVPGISHRAS